METIPTIKTTSPPTSIVIPVIPNITIGPQWSDIIDYKLGGPTGPPPGQWGDIKDYKLGGPTGPTPGIIYIKSDTIDYNPKGPTGPPPGFF